MSKPLGQYLHEIRKYHNRSLAETATLSGFSPESHSLLERHLLVNAPDKTQFAHLLRGYGPLTVKDIKMAWHLHGEYCPDLDTIETDDRYRGRVL